MALYEQLEQNGKVMVGRILSNFKKFLSTTDDPQNVKFGTAETTGNLTVGGKVTGGGSADGINAIFRGTRKIKTIDAWATVDMIELLRRSVFIVRVWRFSNSNHRGVYLVDMGLSGGDIVTLYENTPNFSVSISGQMFRVTNTTASSDQYIANCIGVGTT